MKNLNKLATVAVVSFIFLLVGGCTLKVKHWQIEAAKQFCADRGGVAEFDTLYSLTVECNDGKIEFLSSLRAN